MTKTVMRLVRSGEENAPFVAVQEGDENLPFLDEVTDSNDDVVGGDAMMCATTGLSVRAQREWDVKISPIKKVVIAGKLVPTMNSAVGFLRGRQKRKLSLELQGPIKARNQKASPFSKPIEALFKKGREEVTQSSLDQSQLKDGEAFFLRSFKKSSKLVGIGSPPPPSDGSIFHFHSASTGVWREHRAFKLEDVKILKSQSRTLEIQTGADNETTTRDVKFRSEKEAKSFEETVKRMMSLERDRGQRQMAEWQGTKKVFSEDNTNKDEPSFFETAKSNFQAVFQPRTGAGGSEGNSISALDENINVLVEIVSVTDLPTRSFFSMSACYVIARLGGKEVHRTSAITKIRSPIWTLQDGSLFLLQSTPDEFFAASGGMTFVLCACDGVSSHRSDEVIGYVYISLEDVLHGTGERLGFDIVPAKASSDNGKNELKLTKIRLYLRFRDATREDIDFFSEYNKKSNRVGVYTNETFLPLRPPPNTLLKFQKKKGKNRELLYRVKPFPDPAREEETTWMTKEQIIAESKKPSTHWIESGSGNLGKLYVELLGCDDLPNMDSFTPNIWDATDTFACLIFEDGLVNSDIIGNCLSPRWMPWCRRAFVFNITHPSSNLLIGVFDQDPEISPLQMVSHATGDDLHDIVGRVQVQLSNFAEETVYTLAYPLYYGGMVDQRQQSRGKLWIRLRKEWRAPRKAIVAASARLLPPPTIVSVARTVDFEVANYTAEGPHEDTGFDLTAFTRYIEELQSYKVIVVSLKSAALTVWLWRGHYRVRIFQSDIFLPLHSITAFVWGNIVAWDYNRFLSFLLFAIGWALLACNEFANKNPSPWLKKRGYWHLWWLVVTGATLKVKIDPYQDVDATQAFQEQEEERQRRLKRELELKAEQEVEVKKELGHDTDGAQYIPLVEVDTTPNNSRLLDHLNVNPLKPVLYPVQLQLRQVIIGLRIAKSFLLWEECIYAFWIVTACFIGSILTFWVPFELCVRWVLRIAAFLVLGPWMAIVDHLYFRERPDMTDEQKDEEVRKRLRARYEKLVLAASNSQIRKERAAKLKSMKTFMFGQYHVSVPRFSNDLFRDTPLPESFATPYNREGTPIQIAERKFGQHLEGDMIPKREIQMASQADDERTRMLSLRTVGGLASSAGGKVLRFIGEEGRRLKQKDLNPAERIPLLGHAVGGIGRKLGPMRNGGYDAVEAEDEVVKDQQSDNP